MSPATAGTSAARVRDHLLRILGPVAAGVGCDLEDVVVSPAGRRTLVRVVVDADGGVDLDAVADVSRAVSDMLDTDADTQAVLAGSYVLEVTSPGVDRPLVEPRHWRRNRGRLVRVAVGDETVTGRIVDTGDDGVTFDVDGAARLVRWPDLGRGSVQVEFNRRDEHSEQEE